MEHMTKEQKIDRYLALVEWARKRYTKSCRLTISIGNRASRYSRIESAAAVRYLGCRI